MNLVCCSPLSETEEKTNVHDELDQKISAAQKEIADVLGITEQYTGQRKEYQTIYNKKTGELRSVYYKYSAYLLKNMKIEDHMQYEEYYQDFEDFSGTMGFGGGEEGYFGGFDSYEEFYENHQQEERLRRDREYKKVNVEDVYGELADALKDLTSKDIWRKISMILHPDKLALNKKITDYKDFFDFLTELYRSLGEFYKKSDKGALIIALKDAGIRYIDGDFVFPTLSQFQAGAMRIYKQKILNELIQKIQLIKSTSIYAFYLASLSGDDKSKLQEIDDEIQKIEDLLSSYQQTPDDNE